MQVTQTGETTVFFEQSPLDTLGMPFTHTQSQPVGQTIHGVTCGKGNGVCGFSRIFTVQGQPAQQSLTQNFLYGGNCALAYMAEKSQARSIFCEFLEHVVNYSLSCKTRWIGSKRISFSLNG